jgi:hypothetical protein
VNEIKDNCAHDMQLLTVRQDEQAAIVVLSMQHVTSRNDTESCDDICAIIARALLHILSCVLSELFTVVP